MHRTGRGRVPLIAKGSRERASRSMKGKRTQGCFSSLYHWVLVLLISVALVAVAFLLSKPLPVTPSSYFPVYVVTPSNGGESGAALNPILHDETNEKTGIEVGETSTGDVNEVKWEAREARKQARKEKRKNSLKLRYYGYLPPFHLKNVIGFPNTTITGQNRHCLTQACFADSAKSLARAFTEPTSKEQWCVPVNGRKGVSTTTDRKRQGLMLVKVPKAASSTMAGVVLRLGHRHNCNMEHIHWTHEKTYKVYSQRDRSQSFMLLSVREPSRQIMSFVFWKDIAVRGKNASEVSDELLLKLVKGFSASQGTFLEGQGGLTTQYASLEPVPRFSAWSRDTGDVIAPDMIAARIKSILNGYDFIAVVERMDESLVALALLLGVNAGDVLITSSKVSARGDDKAYVYIE